MRFATVEHDGWTQGAVISADGTTAHLLAGGMSVDDLIPQGLSRMLEVGAEALTQDGLPIDQVNLRMPFKPRAIRDFVAFEEHVVGVRRSVDGQSGVPEQWYAAPTFYFTNPHALLGPGDPITRPDSCRALDFELEVAAVLAKGGSSLTEDQAADAILGYTIFNDWSARDLQSAEMKVGLGPAKGKDLGSSLGPWLVTADEFDDAYDADGFLTLNCSVSLNGNEIGRDSLDHMGWTFATMIAYASRDSLVVPGDVLASGTTGGGGCLAELWGRSGTQNPPPLEPGDEVSITVDRLGTLTSTVVAGRPAPTLTPFRPAPHKRER